MPPKFKDEREELPASSGPNTTQAPTYSELCDEVAVSRSRVHELKKRFEISLRNSPICVFLQDAELRYLWVYNPPVGITEKDLVGYTDREIFPPTTAETAIALKQKSLASQTLQRGELTIQDGIRTRCFDVQVEPYFDITGKMIGVLGVAVELTEQRQREEQLRQALKEMSHRSKNQLTTLLSILKFTAKSATDVCEFTSTFEERLRGLVKMQDLLVANDWRGVPLNDLIEAQADVVDQGSIRRISLSGPRVFLRPEPAQNLGLAFHELFRNAHDCGALSNEEGQIGITWSYQQEDNGIVRLRWSEKHGPEVSEPTKLGFGLTIITRILQQAIDGSVELDFRPTGMKAQMRIGRSCLTDNH